MLPLLLSLMFAAAEPDAETYLKTLPADDAENVRFLDLSRLNEKQREEYFKLVSFVLNSVSNKAKITRPVFLNKTTLRFDLRDYGLSKKSYESLPNDPYNKKVNGKLEALTKSKKTVMRADFFIIKAMTAPHYYKLMEISNLSDFRKRFNHDPKKKVSEQAAVVVLSNISRNTRYIKRIPTTNGSIWESRESALVDYLKDLTSDKYDSIQLLAFNPNGLISYFVADDGGKPLDAVGPEIAIDNQRNFDPDLVVRSPRNCIACHTVGIISVKDEVRQLLEKNIELIAPDKEAKDKLADLFSTDLPVEKDQNTYKEALEKATGLEPKDFTKKFISVWKIYYADLTVVQASSEMGISVDAFKEYCRQSRDPRLLGFVVFDKLSRTYFEKVSEER